MNSCVSTNGHAAAPLGGSPAVIIIQIREVHSSNYRPNLKCVAEPFFLEKALVVTTLDLDMSVSRNNLSPNVM